MTDAKQAIIEIPGPTGYRHVQVVFGWTGGVGNIDSQDVGEVAARIGALIRAGDEAATLEFHDPMHQEPWYMTYAGARAVVAICTAYMDKARPTAARGGRVHVPMPGEFPLTRD